MSENFFALILNFIVTLSCGALIYYFIYSKRVETHYFYYFWAIGFILYAFEIFTRIFLMEYSLLAVLCFGFNFFFALGLWYLCRRKIFLISLIALYSLIFLLSLVWITTNLIPFNMARILGFFFTYGGMTIFMFYHRVTFGKTADRFIFGWLFLCVTNLLLGGEGWIADTFAIFAKFILLIGIIDHNFIILTQRIREELVLHRLPINTGYEKDGGLKLVMPRSERLPLMEVCGWVRSRVNKNVEQGVKTNLVVLQNVIPYNILRRIAWRKPDMVHVFVFSHNPTGKEEFTTLRMGITEIGATLTEITKKHTKEEAKDEVILVDLSILIHTFGVHEAYSLLLNKMGALRSSGVPLVAVFHPETHEKSVVSLFKTITDDVIQL